MHLQLFEEPDKASGRTGTTDLADRGSPCPSYTEAFELGAKADELNTPANDITPEPKILRSCCCRKNQASHPPPPSQN